MAMMQKASQAAQAQDPGKVDTTSQEALDNPDIQGPQSLNSAVTVAREAAGRMEGPLSEEEEASPEEQEAYERATEALYQVLYSNEGTSRAIVDMLQPEEKIGSVVKAALMTVTELDKKIDMDENVIPQIAMDTADMLIELGERAKGMEFSEQEAQAVAGATWEGVLNAYGIDESAVEEISQGMSPEEIAAQESNYKQFLGD